MRARWLAVSAFVAGTAFAAGYSPIQVDEYDPSTGLYYRTIQRDYVDGAFVSTSASETDSINLNIYDPATEASATFFREPQIGGLSVVIYETGWKDGAMRFNVGTSALHILDNDAVPAREPKDRLLVGTYVESTKETTLWVSDKHGNDARKLATVPQSADWHLDVRNSKVRVVYQSSQGIIIETYAW